MKKRTSTLGAVLVAVAMTALVAATAVIGARPLVFRLDPHPVRAVVVVVVDVGYLGLTCVIRVYLHLGAP